MKKADRVNLYGMLISGAIVDRYRRDCVVTDRRMR